jgi:hypothetical protein
VSLSRPVIAVIIIAAVVVGVLVGMWLFGYITAPGLQPDI